MTAVLLTASLLLILCCDTAGRIEGEKEWGTNNNLVACPVYDINQMK
jgi:hypothetical protein